MIRQVNISTACKDGTATDGPARQMQAPALCQQVEKQRFAANIVLRRY
jgi:hypothetical protein